MLFHLVPVAGDQVVPAGLEQPLDVVPGRAHERNPASERLEGADGGNAGEGPDVGTARHVDGYPGAREQRRRLEVRQPPAVLDPGVTERSDRVLRITDAVDDRVQAQILHRLEEEFVQLRRAFAVAPVAYPDEVPLLAFDARVEDARVRRLVPGPGLLRPAVVEIEVAHHPSEGEDTVVPG